MKDKVKDIIQTLQNGNENYFSTDGSSYNFFKEGLFELELELSDLYREICDLKHSNEYLKAELEKGDDTCNCPQENICEFLNRDTDKCEYGKK